MNVENNRADELANAARIALELDRPELARPAHAARTPARRPRYR
jgi:hypothetical protein